jgi:hypothetical protein
MNKNSIFETKFRQVFQKAFPDIKISPFRYGTDEGFNYTHFIIPPQNKNLQVSNYFTNKRNGYYHFTSLNALLSIISTKVFRSYNLNHLKDPREFLYAGNLIPLESKFIDDARENFFILSFCENIHDILPAEKFNIWRLYGGDGNGCIIKISFIENDPVDWHNFYLSKVYYGINARSHISHISELLKDINKDNKYLGIDLGQIMCFHKSSLYRSEKEVRLLYDKREKKGLSSTSHYNSDNQLTFPIIRTEISDSFDSKIKYLEIPIINFSNIPTEEHIPVIKINQVILGYRLKNQFEKVKTELEVVFKQKLGYCPSISLSKLSKTFWGY